MHVLFHSSSFVPLILDYADKVLVDKNNETKTKKRLKVIPLKLFYYQTFFEIWHSEHL